MNVEQLRKQAKELVRAARAGEADAVARFGDLPVQARERPADPRARAWLPELARARPRRGRAAVPHRPRVLRGSRGGDRDGERRSASPRRAATSPGGTASRAGPRCGSTCRRWRAGRRRRRRSCSPTAPNEAGDRCAAGRAARRAPRARRDARHERQRPVRDGERHRDHAAAARARGGREPRQRLRLDEAPPGRVRKRPSSSRGCCSTRARAPTCSRAATEARR